MNVGSIRACATASFVAAALSLANAAIGFTDTNSDDPETAGDYAAVLVFSAALIGAATALAFLRRLLADPSPRAVKVGLFVAAVGAALAGVGNLIEDALGVSAFGLAFVLGGMALIIGVLTAATAVLITQPLWRWMGITLVLLAVGFVVGEEAGFALVALMWLALAFGLVAPRRRAGQT